MFTAHVGKHIFNIQVTEGNYLVDGEAVAIDVSKVQDNYFHVLLNGRSYRAEIVEASSDGKQFSVKVNGVIYPVALKDKFDLVLEKMGIHANAGPKLSHIRAPMPGLIIAMKVKDGDAVKTGDTLLILEAMKMENIIKAPGDAIVKSVKVKLGEGVEKNQVLIEFKPA